MKRCYSESAADQYSRDSTLLETNGATAMRSNDDELDSSGSDATTHRKSKCLNHTSEQESTRRICNYAICDLIDVAIRIAFVFIFIKLERMQAYKRLIHKEEMWMYKNPRTPDIISPTVLLLSVILGPFCTTLLHFYLTGNRRDFRAASWVWTLALCLNGMATSVLKVTVGRPRPDFFYRCFPDGKEVLSDLSKLDFGGMSTPDIYNCTGNPYEINEGRKSFPSGHSSFAFTGFGFIAFYVGGKLQALNRGGRGESWRLLITLMPLILASLIGISRVCDYHHHPLDVFAGAIIGSCITYMVYRQYYPSVFDRSSNQPFVRAIPSTDKRRQLIGAFSETNNRVCNLNEEYQPLISSDIKDGNKWI